MRRPLKTTTFRGTLETPVTLVLRRFAYSEYRLEPGTSPGWSRWTLRDRNGFSGAIIHFLSPKLWPWSDRNVECENIQYGVTMELKLKTGVGNDRCTGILEVKDMDILPLLLLWAEFFHNVLSIIYVYLVLLHPSSSSLMSRLRQIV